MPAPAGRRRAIATLAVAILAVTVPAARARTSISSPNIVLILVDDMRWDYLPYMPVVRDDLMAQGVTFRNAFVENPMCCPSRATILTGNASQSRRSRRRTTRSAV